MSQPESVWAVCAALVTPPRVSVGSNALPWSPRTAPLWPALAHSGPLWPVLFSTGVYSVQQPSHSPQILGHNSMFLSLHSELQDSTEYNKQIVYTVQSREQCPAINSRSGAQATQLLESSQATHNTLSGITLLAFIAELGKSQNQTKMRKLRRLRNLRRLRKHQNFKISRSQNIKTEKLKI